jgi:acetoin utilization protein AcuB
MFVGLRMTRSVPVCAPDDGLDKAIQVMREKKVRQLIVTEGDRIAGVLSRIDLQHVLPSTATTLSVNEMNYQLSRLKVADYMTRKVVSVAQDATIEEAARLMHDSDVSGLPVVKDGRLVGLINRTMMLAVFIEEMGLQVESSRITLALDDKPGQILSVSQVIKERGLNIVSVATFFPEPSNQRLVVFRVKTNDPKPVEAALAAAGYKIVTAADFGL